ncbi:uncharacterized protein [Henckelia pumila]|uniref:uncharacterized protein n=1 Tax=Henckelia pumila TaxID=405737 RepID=UPI003C6E2F40
MKAECWKKDKQQGDATNILYCNYCKKYGLVQEQCWKKNRQVNYAVEQEEEANLFMAYQEDAKSLRLGDDKQMQVEGKGTAEVIDGNGNIKLLYNVYFIPDLTQNLLGVGQLMGSGYSIFFDDNSCVIRDKKSNQVIVDVQMAPNKLFPLEVSVGKRFQIN